MRLCEDHAFTVSAHSHKPVFCLCFQISIVGQEPVLFARTIEENISYGLDLCAPERIQRAAQMANAHAFIEDMKDKYKTEAGEKGVQLSGNMTHNSFVGNIKCTYFLLFFLLKAVWKSGM